MKTAKKNNGKKVFAYRLGDNTEIEKKLLGENKIRLNDDGSYEVFSREATTGTGEKAYAGDYIKLDSGGYPYPNEKNFFESHHRKLADGTYEQIPIEVSVWTADDGMCDEVRFLIREKSLKINEADPDRYFAAPLWGTTLTAARDAVIVFYEIKRDEDGKISDADFNFVERNEFNKTYTVIS